MIGFLLIAFIFPLLGVAVAVAGLCVNPSNWRKYLPPILFGLFIGAYAFIPPDHRFDLFAYLPKIEESGRLTFLEALKMDGDILFSSHIMFWFFGRLHLPHLVPAITTASVYGAAFYMTCDTAERHDAKKYIGPLIIFQAAMMPYIMILNNVRNVFGLVMVILAVYLDVVKKNRKWYVYALYVLGGLFHLSTLLLIVVRVFAGLSKKLVAFLVPVPILFPMIAKFLYANIGLIPDDNSIGHSLRVIIWKMYGYITMRDLDYAVKSLNSISLGIDRVVMLVGMTMSVILIYYLLHKGKVHTKDNANFYAFAGVIALMTLSCNAFAMPNFWRFAAAFYATAGVIAVPLLLAYKKIPQIMRVMLYCFMAIGCFCLMFQYVRYGLESLLNWFANAVHVNLITIIVDFIKAL